MLKSATIFIVIFLFYGGISLNFVILGAGAVGGYFGGKLALAGNNVTFLVREKRAGQLKNRGLKVQSIHGDFSIEPKIALSVSEIEQPDIVIVAVKNYHLEQALPQLHELVNKGAKILPLLNGIGHIDILRETFGDKSTLGGLCQIETTLNADGDIVQTSKMQDLIFGAFDHTDHAWLQEAESIMKEANIDVVLSENILVDLWKKYIFITSLSGITASLRSPIGVAVNDKEAFAFLKELIQEVIDVAIAREVPLPDETFDQIVQKIQSLPGQMTASMHRDLEKGLPMELDSIHGTLLSMAANYNLQTPCLKAIYALLNPFKYGINK